MKRRGLTGRRGVAALLVAAAVAVPGAPALANRPIIGVACEGGFYVRAPNGRIFWIHGEPTVRTEVHSGRDRIVRMAECGAGVVSVFEGPDPASPSRVYFSGDCLNIGTEVGATTRLYEGPKRVTGLLVDEAGVTIRFGGGDSIASPVCTARPETSSPG